MILKETQVFTDALLNAQDALNALSVDRENPVTIGSFAPGATIPTSETNLPPVAYIVPKKGRIQYVASRAAGGTQTQYVKVKINGTEVFATQSPAAGMGIEAHEWFDVFPGDSVVSTYRTSSSGSSGLSIQIIYYEQADAINIFASRT